MKSFRVSHLDFWFALLLFLPLLLAGEKSAKGQQVFSIDPKNSFVTIHVDKTGLFSFAAHTHEVVASPVRGQVIFDPNQPANSSVWVEFDAQTLTVTGKGEPSEDVPEVQRTMLSDQVLDVKHFPTILFRSRTVSATAKTADGLTLTVAGDLTLHGVTRPITAAVKGSLGENIITARGTLTIKQTDFGIEPVTAALGFVKVKDDLDMSFILTARR